MCDALSQAFFLSEEVTFLGFWSMYPMCFIDFCLFFIYLNVFLPALGSPSRVRVCCAACGASNPQKKHAPGFLEHVPYVFY